MTLLMFLLIAVMVLSIRMSAWESSVEIEMLEIFSTTDALVHSSTSHNSKYAGCINKCSVHTESMHTHINALEL